MERIAVFVDDAEHARRLLEPLLNSNAPATHWLMVICAPRMTRRIGKWVSHQQREQWRAKWGDRLREQLLPLFARRNDDEVHWEQADHVLSQMTQRLRKKHGTALRVLDARRPKLGQPFEGVSGSQPTDDQARWTAPIAVSSSLSVMLALVD
jgi:hypothetical protein